MSSLMRKAVTRGLLALISVAAVACVVAWQHRSETKKETEIDAKQREVLTKVVAELKETHEMVARMASAHNAVTDWPHAFSGQRFADNLSVSDLDPALIRKDGRPLLVFGSILDVIANDKRCELELDAKANLVSNIRFLLTCTPGQVNEALRHRQEAYKEALEEIRGDADPESETPQQKQDDDREAELESRRGYAFIARVTAIHSGEAETIDDPSYKAHFTFAEGKCLELFYVGRDYDLFTRNHDAYLRLNTSEREDFARLEGNALKKAMRSLETQKRGAEGAKQ